MLDLWVSVGMLLSALVLVGLFDYFNTKRTNRRRLHDPNVHWHPLNKINK